MLQNVTKLYEDIKLNCFKLHFVHRNYYFKDNFM